MKMTLELMMMSFALGAFVGGLVLIGRGGRKTGMAGNSSAGKHSGTFILASALTARHLLVKVDAGGTVSLAGAADNPIGTSQDEGVIGEAVYVMPLGSDYQEVQAAGAIASGARVFAAANGQVAASGTIVLGRAVSAASAAGDYLTIIGELPLTL